MYLVTLAPDSKQWRWTVLLTQDVCTTTGLLRKRAVTFDALKFNKKPAHLCTFCVLQRKASFVDVIPSSRDSGSCRGERQRRDNQVHQVACDKTRLPRRYMSHSPDSNSQLSKSRRLSCSVATPGGLTCSRRQIHSRQCALLRLAAVAPSFCR